MCFIPKDEIIKDLEKNPDFTMDILKTMANSLKKSENSVVNMAQKNVKQRLAETLLNLHSEFKTNQENAINIHLSREDIANIIGTATESAIRLLSDLKKREIIAFKGKDIIIVNKIKLEKIAQGFSDY